MSASSIGSRLKAQLTKFSLALSEGLTRPQRKFVHPMLYGIQATQDVKLSAIARSLQEKLALIKTANRVVLNVTSEASSSHLEMLPGKPSMMLPRLEVFSWRWPWDGKAGGNTSEPFSLATGGPIGRRSRRCWTSFVRTRAITASTLCDC